MKYVIELGDGDVVRVLCGMETSIVSMNHLIEKMERNNYSCLGQKLVRQLIIDALTSVTSQIEAQASARQGQSNE